MRFSWTGLILAPLLAPVFFSTSMALFVASGDIPMGFVMMLTAGCVVSYGATILIFLPCLFILSLERHMTGFKVCLLGLVTGALVFVSLTFIAWCNIDPNSAPPVTFFAFLCWTDHGAVSAGWIVNGGALLEVGTATDLPIPIRILMVRGAAELPARASHPARSSTHREAPPDRAPQPGTRPSAPAALPS
jgi:hypothetical protein